MLRGFVPGASPLLLLDRRRSIPKSLQARVACLQEVLQIQQDTLALVLVDEGGGNARLAAASRTTDSMHLQPCFRVTSALSTIECKQVWTIVYLASQ